MLTTRCALVFALAFVPAAFAQYTAGKIVFKNQGPYKQSDLESVAQLHAHDKVSNAVVQAAAQRLVDTGYFDNVGASLAGPVAAVHVTFVLKPLAAEQMTTVGFENFVWITPEERNAAIHAVAPLFAGSLPEAGDQAELVAGALTAAVAAKGIAITVVREQLEPSLMQPTRAIEHRADKPSVRIHAVTLNGVSPALAPEVQKLALTLRNSRYNEGLAKPNANDRLLMPYFNAGYVEARLNNTHRDIVESTSAGVNVDVSATVDAGDVYRVSTLRFAGTPLVSPDSVMTNAKLHSGDIASHKLLLETLSPIDAAYRRLGYMDVFVDPGMKLDAATHTVSYDITVLPGEQYRLRTVTPNGLSAAAQSDFDKGWQMKTGALYNPEYVAAFLKNNTALRSLQDYSCHWRASGDPQTHLVDLTLNCFPAKGETIEVHE